MSKTTTAKNADRQGLPVRDYPNTTPDGLTWLDPEGNPPQYAEGRLVADFVLTDDMGYRMRWTAGTRGPLPPTHRAWAIFKAACQKARELKKRVPGSVEEAVAAHLAAGGVEPDVALPEIPEAPARVALTPVEPPRKGSDRPKRPLSELTAKQRYDRLWNEAKREGPEAFARFKADWAAGKIEGSPTPKVKAEKPAKAPKAPKTVKAPKADVVEPAAEAAPETPAAAAA